MPNANFNDLLTTTLNNHMPKLVDNIFTARPLFWFLKQADQIRQVSGGAKIVLPVMYATNTSAIAYSGAGQLSTTAQTFMTAAEYDWKQFAVSITIQGIEEAKNNGEEEVIDLLESRVLQAEETIGEEFDKMFIQSDGSTYTTGVGGQTWTGTDSWNGLATLVAQNSSAVGNINPSSDTWWQSTINTTTEALSISRMTNVYNTVSVGSDQPTFGLTTQTLYEKYESLLQPQMRFTDSKTADAGFQNLLFKGAPVVYDTYVQSGYFYFLNSKYLRLVGHKDVWFKATPFVRPYNYDVRYAQILCYGNLTISNRKRQGVMTNKS